LGTPLRLIALARLAPNKRVDHVVRALALLREQGCEAELTIIGWGQDQWRIEAQIDELDLSDAVTIAGHLYDAEKNIELQKAHLLLHTSMREGWGLNVIEANAMGTLAVVYPVGGLVDSTVHGQTGLVSEAETPESLAKAVIGLANDPEKYDAMRTAAWERSFDFRWESVLPPTCDWLENMARDTEPV
jgi:glycosyltransferase involved in cell wall biosynthesis